MKAKKIIKRILKIAVIILGVFVLLFAINFIPTLNLKTNGMSIIKGNWVNVYYETEKAAATDTFQLADKRAGELAKLLGITKKQDINIYIYDKQSTMQTKKYGFIAPHLGLDWYIGDNIGTNVILTSPANPGKVHDYDNNKNAVLHEMVHAYNSSLNNHMTYWVDNGLAGYLSQQIPNKDLCNYCPIPTLKQTQVSGIIALITFENFGGYEYSYTYIQYLVETYSWDKVVQFAKSGDYKGAFGIGESEIYSGWVKYVRTHYSR
ncbi:MAG TPA: hypothetical protein VHO94_02430 [Oscillospiraceae bacterium]|nr:hypothetical protein [Oscillospiraceae bacterium]